MGMGYVSCQTLTAIANAIRWQAYELDAMVPGAMADAVTALTGIRMNYTYATFGGVYDHLGLLSRDVLQGIADAIRAQNGLTTLYKPGDMPQAIRDLTWPETLYALLCDDGTLEFSYGRKHEPGWGRTAVAAYPVDPTAGYDIAGAPWYERQAEITRVVFHNSVASAGVTNAANWFWGCRNLVEVEGFQYLSGVTNVSRMFCMCYSLESIWCDGSFDTGAIADGSYCLYGCARLVGGALGTVDSYGSGSLLNTGTSGVLVSHSADDRQWVYAYYYAPEDDENTYYSGDIDELGGDYTDPCTYGDDVREIVVTASSTPDETRRLVQQVRLCPSARYQGSYSPMPGGVQGEPWRAVYCRRVTIDPSVAGIGLTQTHLDLWFRSFRYVMDISGLQYLPSVTSMEYAFYGCERLTEIDLSGLSSSAITACTYAFNSCRALATIYADQGFGSAPTVASSYVFSYCSTALVGGAGTKWKSSATDSSYLRIDGGADAPGYLTLKSSE